MTTTEITNITRVLETRYRITANVSGVPDIDKARRWTGDIDKTMRPSKITVIYDGEGNTWDKPPDVHVYGKRLRKDGTLGTDMRLSLTWDLDEAPQWVLDFIEANKPPRVMNTS